MISTHGASNELWAFMNQLSALYCLVSVVIGKGEKFNNVRPQ